MTCSKCDTDIEDRIIQFGDRKMKVTLCEHRAANLEARYRNTRFDGVSTAAQQPIGLFDGKKQRRRKTA